GEIFRVSTWGESHGKALGVVIDGCPAGIPLSEGDFAEAMARRAPGQTKYATPRSEADEVELLSGVFEGKTTGTPISLMIRNTSQRSGDYSEVASYYRPGHADYGFDAKYGFRDYRGGGRSSGRETAARVAAGVVAERFLAELGIRTTAYVKQIGPCVCEKNVYTPGEGPVDASGARLGRYVPEKDQIEKSPLRMPDPEASGAAEEYLCGCMEETDSAGGLIECVVTGMPAGVGDPVFDKLDALLGQAIFSIGAVKGVEIGAGFSVVESRGSENNDAFVPVVDGSGVADGQTPRPAKATNASGGILGGISDGDDIVLRAAFKPTPSIAKEQQTVNQAGESVTISVKGRHDPIIVPRAVVVVESMVNLVLVDRLLVGMGARMDRIREFYRQ
ncbi:MAG: chorismate synthase, partial [Eubacterium sp.]|nr:chorismate synthase [Eubacterium sp.]